MQTRNKLLKLSKSELLKLCKQHKIQIKGCVTKMDFVVRLIKQSEPKPKLKKMKKTTKHLILQEKTTFIVSFWIRNALNISYNIYYRDIIAEIVKYVKHSLFNTVIYGIGIATKGTLIKLNWTETINIENIYNGLLFRVYQSQNGEYFETPKISFLSDKLQNVQIHKLFVSNYSNTTFLMDKNNKIYEYNRINSQIDPSIPLKCFTDKPVVVDIQSAHNYSIFRTANGCVYRNDYYHNLQKWVKRIPLTNIIQIKCGWYHTLLLNGNGSVFIMAKSGFTDYGQLGNGSCEYRAETAWNRPKANKYFQTKKIKIKTIAVGAYHCLVLSKKDVLYSWGRNDYDQCGLNQYLLSDGCSHGTEDTIKRPRKIQAFKNKHIQRIQCGQYNCCAISRKGRIWLWGRNISNGINSKLKTIATPTLLHNAIPDTLKLSGDLYKIILAGSNIQFLMLE